MRYSYSLSGILFGGLLAGCSALASAETLQGRLIDRASLEASAAGKGIAGARVTLFDAGGKKLAVKTTAKQGRYLFPKIPAGTYTLSIERKEYFPSRLLRVITITAEDTLSRNFTLDRIPLQGGLPARRLGKKKNAGSEYYPLLAEGMLAGMKLPDLHRESAVNRVSLSRFFDAEDTTEAYRALWSSLLWADIESQGRPIEADVYLAHALDSALSTAGIPAPAALKPYLKVPEDSLEAVSSAVRAMILAPSKKQSPDALFKKQVPRSMVSQIIEAQLGSKALPKPKRKAFLAKVKSQIGGDAARRLTVLIDPPKKKPAKAKPEAPAGPPQPDMTGIWKAVVEASGGKRPNPVALFHVASRRMDMGQTREALADLDRLGGLRPGYPQAAEAAARCKLALSDTAGAERLYGSLSAMESTDWQARGFRGLAGIQWRSGRADKAEAALWRAMGLDSRSPSAREAVMLLAEISLERDTWNPVEGLLDSLVKSRPRDADGHYWLGRMALKRQQDGVALDHFRKACALAPQRPDFAAAVAAAHFAREECDAAIKALKPVRAKLTGEGLSIYGQCLLRQGKAKEAVREFERLQTDHPSPENLAQWSRALSASGDPARAISVIQASSFSSHPEVRKAMASAQIDQGSPELARQLLEPLVASKANDAEAHFLLGRAAFALRDYSDASKRFSSALQYREDYPEAKYSQGLSLLKMGRSGEAHHYFLELADSDKPSWRAKGLLGQGQAFAKEEKMEAAVENLRRSFLAVPGAEAAAHLALACLRLSQTQEASDWAAKARKLDPDEPLGLMASVDVLLAGHKEAEAVALAQAGLDGHPDVCDFMVVAAKAHLRAGHDEEAKVLSQRARSRCPEESAAYYYLGTLSARAGTMAEARRHFGDYLRTGGDAKRVPEAYR